MEAGHSLLKRTQTAFTNYVLPGLDSSSSIARLVSMREFPFNASYTPHSQDQSDHITVRGYRFRTAKSITTNSHMVGHQNFVLSLEQFSFNQFKKLVLTFYMGFLMTIIRFMRPWQCVHPLPPSNQKLWLLQIKTIISRNAFMTKHVFLCIINNVTICLRLDN